MEPFDQWQPGLWRQQTQWLFFTAWASNTPRNSARRLLRSQDSLTHLGFATSKNLTPDVRVFGFARFESYASAANRDSPLFLSTNGTAIGIAMNWTLGRSRSRVSD